MARAFSNSRAWRSSKLLDFKLLILSWHKAIDDITAGDQQQFAGEMYHIIQTRGTHVAAPYHVRRVNHRYTQWQTIHVPTMCTS